MFMNMPFKIRFKKMQGALQGLHGARRQGAKSIARSHIVNVEGQGLQAVSYTHLDVYKRQGNTWVSA